MSAPTFDLQSHSTHSDGALPAAEVVARAAAAGVEMLALSDHDTVGGVDEALAAGWTHGVNVVRSSEISSIDGEHEDLHILGYDIDHHDPAFLVRLDAWREDRSARIGRMEDALRELGWSVNQAPLDARRAEGKPVGRPHLAQATYHHPDNAQRLKDEGLDADFSKLLVAYLIPGTPAYRQRTTPTVGEAIEAIHAAGGVAVWAHPFWDIKKPDVVLGAIARFQDDHGLDGVEAFYAAHDEAQTRLLARTADERGLLSTGSADYHGPDHPQFSKFRAFELYGLTPNLGTIGAAE